MSRTILFTTATLLLLGAPALAQDNRDYGRPIDTPQNRADMAQRRAAYCVIDRVPAVARKVLASGIGSSDEAKVVKSLPSVGRECFGDGWPEFNPTSFRNALAEVEYQARYNLKDPAPAGTGPKQLPATFAVVPAGQRGTPQQEVSWQLAAIARCTVFLGPAQSRRLIMGPRNVPEEDKRFAALTPSIEQCVDVQSAKLLTPRLFRGFIASAVLDRATRYGR